MNWLIASNNHGKSGDLRACLAYYGLTAECYDRYFSRLTFPAETTSSYVTNAVTKARFAAQRLGQPVIADDSGIEIPALPGQLGVTTARDLGVAVSGFQRNQEILTALTTCPNSHRQATMWATLAAAWPDGHAVWAQGSLSAYISSSQLGAYSGGFDRIFWLPAYGRTLAELPAVWRIPLTHRGQAARRLVRQLQTLKGSVS